MPWQSAWTRRNLIQAFLGWFWAHPILGAGTQVEDADWIQRRLSGFRRCSVSSLRYRIDATILVFGAPLLTRKGVGEAYASVEFARLGETSAVALQFAAGCWPERARDLNRFGILREAVIQRENGHAEHVFAGLITTSKEDSLDDARNSLGATHPRTEITIARGEIRDGQLTAWTEHIQVAPEFRWPDAADLLGQVLRREPACKPNKIAVDRAPTFLAAMRNAALQPALSHRFPFLHSGKTYLLHAQPCHASTAEVACVITNSMGIKTAEFRTSYSSGSQSGIPEFIDYRPKSFLRLALYAEQEVARTPVPSIFTEEGF